MKHLILGTAGHVDHGKTALTQALTNIDCDTHPEEKRRGITINLGFAHLDLPSGDSLGIVDVPGHKDFVNTMIAGANGIDIVLLVVAADSGVMPQTVEHLRIMETLGIKTGLVALTKIDRVDEESALMAEGDVQDLLEGTFLENSPIVPVSAVTGEGIAELRQRLDELAVAVEARKGGEAFRMFIDRVFSVSGHGTVVTGSVLGGTARRGEKLYLLPGDAEVRLRRIERHGEEVDEVRAGDRASLNLVGMSREDFRRGMIVSDQVVDPTTMVDAKLELFPHSPDLGTWSQAVFILGTFTAQAKVHLIDCDRLRGGESAIAQIHLGAPCVTQYGDRFVLRSSSADTTLGGGELIDVHPLFHRRRPETLLRTLERISVGGLAGRISAEVHKHPTPVAHTDVAVVLGVSGPDVLEAVAESPSNDIAVVPSTEAAFLMPRAQRRTIETEVLAALTAHHAERPFEEEGRTFEELRGLFGVRRNATTDAVTKLVLGQLVGGGTLKTVGRTYAVGTHEIALSPQDVADIELIEAHLEGIGMRIPQMAELISKAERNGIAESRLLQLLRWSVNRGHLYNIDGHFIHATVVDQGRAKLKEHFAESDEGVTVASFRDLVAGNRKICLLLLKQFDDEGLTMRVGDVRTRRD